MLENTFTPFIISDGATVAIAIPFRQQLGLHQLGAGRAPQIRVWRPCCSNGTWHPIRAALLRVPCVACLLCACLSVPTLAAVHFVAHLSRLWSAGRRKRRHVVHEHASAECDP